MSLSAVPFYSSLVGKEVSGLKLTTGYVLLIGAVVAHCQGAMGRCTASADTIAKEVGLNEKKVQNYRSDLLRVGILEVMEYGPKNSIKSLVYTDLVLDLLKEGRGKLKSCLPKLGRVVPQIGETGTEVATGVGDNIIEMNEEETTGAPIRMKPTALRQQLSLIFKAKDITKSRSTNAIRKLQERIDDDHVILDAAKKMKERGEVQFKDGTTWKADYFWFVNPDKTEAVVRGILKVMSRDLVEEDADPREKKLNDWLVAHGYDLDDPMLVVALQEDKEYQEFMWRLDNGKE